jgi:hypothetical protein
LLREIFCQESAEIAAASGNDNRRMFVRAIHDSRYD